jgi:hypothetical protein
MVRRPDASEAPPLGTLVPCPHCGRSFELTTALAAPLLDEERRRLEASVAEKAAALAEGERLLASRQAVLEEQRQGLEHEVASRVAMERAALVPGLKQQARQEAFAERDAEKEALRAQNSDLMKEMKEATARVVDLLERNQGLEAAARKDSVAAAEAARASREAGRAQAEEEARLKLAEKDRKIGALVTDLERARRMAEQGSEQSQGEVLELDFEGQLRREFPGDAIEPIATGVNGADLLHRVFLPAGECGSILWEVKRTKNWSEAWVGKLVEDQAAAKATFAVLATQALPKDVTTIGLRGKVFVTSLACAPVVAAFLHRWVVELASERQAAQGRREKTASLYDYVRSDGFRTRFDAIYRTAESLQKQLLAEMRVIRNQWKKRYWEIERLITGLTSLGGDFNGILGGSTPVLPALDLQALEAGSDEEPLPPPERGVGDEPESEPPGLLF